ncbi:Fructose-2,6-bisphosphatase TIGAR [Geodia barretti]|uniref:Fructose-2,6-bisphosphatase TIGAR n=1 Tax=Geodia barretti TaxID=519541 RepID=A0AA35TEW8_GEOBA|nr:Fructose-2,6-bisphosphatase TIGAR [Geodia barretti]
MAAVETHLQLTLVRHGETTANKERIIQEHGRNQSQRAGQRLAAAELISHIYCSDLSRAVQTAELIRGELGYSVPVTLDERLRERGYGIHEGRPLTELVDAAREAGVSVKDYTPSGGETQDSVDERLSSFLSDLCRAVCKMNLRHSIPRKDGGLLEPTLPSPHWHVLLHWRQRWCVFTSTGNEPPCLLYFTDRQAVLTGRMPINRVPLESCSKVERALSHSSRPHVFAVHLPERIFYFSAVSHEEMMAWVDALSSHLKLEPQDSAHTPHSRTLERSNFPRAQSPRSSSPPRERSHSLQQPSKKDQPLPPLPFSYPSSSLEPPPSNPLTTSSQDPPPLPERPEELRYSRTPPPPLS